MKGKGWKPSGGGWKSPSWKPSGGGHGWQGSRWRHRTGGGGFSCLGCGIALVVLGFTGALIVVLLAVGVFAGAR